MSAIFSTLAELNWTSPSTSLQNGYRTTAGLFGVLDFYLLLSLIAYEIYIPGKPIRGRKFRLLCLVAVFTAVLHQILQQFIIASSGDSTPVCFALMSLKSTLFNAIVSFTYAFLWLRQQEFYSKPELHKLRGKWMKATTWIVLALLIVNPCIMLGFQFNGELYRAENNTCFVLRLHWYNILPFILVAFSYGLIQVTLIFLYFYPLYKQEITKSYPALVLNIDFTKDNMNKSLQNTPRQAFHTSNDSSQGSKQRSLKASNKSVGGNTSDQSSFSSEKRYSTEIQSLARRLKRWLGLSCICVASDIIAAVIIAVFLLTITPASLISVMFLWHDLSMFINVMCVIGCFNDFRVMLFPFRKIREQNHDLTFLK